MSHIFKLVYIFLIVWLFYINGWAPLIDSIFGSITSILDFVLYILLGVFAITYIFFLFGMKTLKKDHPEFYNFMYLINTFLIGGILSYGLLIFVYVQENFKDPKQIFIYTMQDIKNAHLPYILKSPKDLLNTRGEFLKSKLDTYDKYEKFKEKQLSYPHLSSDEVGGGYHDYAVTQDELEAQEREDQYQDALLMDGENYDSNPGVHEVSGYSRSDGTYVESYERTNPDGIEENNFSYHGR